MPRIWFYKIRSSCALLRHFARYAVKVNVECWKTMIPALQSMPCLAAYAMTLMVVWMWPCLHFFYHHPHLLMLPCLQERSGERNRLWVSLWESAPALSCIRRAGSMIIMTSLGKWERFGRQTCMSARTLLPLVLLLTGGLVGSCMWDNYSSHLFFCPTRWGPVLVRERCHSTCRSKGCFDGIGD